MNIEELYVGMLRIRKFEEKVAELIVSNQINCPVHLYIGQEAVAVGVCANLLKEDLVFSTHRSHGHYLAKGGDMKALMAELFGKVTGCSGGRGGSMHLASPEFGLLGSSAIVAGTIPIAVGSALAFTIQGKSNVSIVFFGDGAVNEGVFYESLNFASLKQLPIVFVCENNLYSTHMPIASHLANTDIYKIADIFNMKGIRIDGNDVLTVHEVAKRVIINARYNNKPSLIECMTYRWMGHVGASYDLDKGIRHKEELEQWMRMCPIKMMEDAIPEARRLSIKETINKEIEEAVSFAQESPYPEENSLKDNVFEDKN